MGHDDHFLRRLDRVDRAEVEFALGLYRDHELVRFLLENARGVPLTAERVAIALAGAGGPHVVVARDGHFVTCLGPGMSTKDLPIVTRSQLEGLIARHARVREGVALAKKRGFDEARLLDRIESGVDAVPREDFVGACAMLGPAVPLLLTNYLAHVTNAVELNGILRIDRRRQAPNRAHLERELYRHVWAMAHVGMVLAHGASRQWIDDWAAGGNEAASPWTALVAQGAYPFATRAAWLAARFGKPMLSAYKARYALPPDAFEVREAAIGLLCMGLRHSSLRGDAMGALLHPPPVPSGAEPWHAQTYAHFAEAAQVIERKEDQLWEEALDMGRGCAVIRAERLPEDSPHRFTQRDEAPEELVLPSLFDAWYDALNGERAGDLMLLGVVAASRARAEDFYFPASFMHAIRPATDSEERARDLVEIQQQLAGPPKTVRREGAHTGRNEPCGCGSGKKFKRCHGA